MTNDKKYLIRCQECRQLIPITTDLVDKKFQDSFVCMPCSDELLQIETGICFEEIWKHNKTGNEYMITSLIHHKENGKWTFAVIYAPVNYNGHQFFYSRPIKNFKEKFTKVEN